ncbi:MAG: rhomboid family intramembrane serine protease [Crocinitomicaceae bacterium]|nr:rhomboid family intramembrane serine protease [Crocinitomicaceae bacterium]MCF8434185.1 rhomboid family intramembrane serine protease [Crocinitomicaceae bacterium]
MNFFNNLPQVTKNILILNILFYVAALVISSKGIDATNLLGVHYVYSPLFKPYQIVTHMFMHDLSSPFHIFFNMFLLVMFGAHLERVWGHKRFFIFYIAAGLGAFALYNGIGVYQLMQAKSELYRLGVDPNSLLEFIEAKKYAIYEFRNPELNEPGNQYIFQSMSVMVGASGALFGLLAGFAMLFPNTELMLLFPPIPVKAKYLIGAYLLFEIYSSFYGRNDQIAHLAHVGGAIVGIVLVLIWRKTDRQNFY